MENEEEEYIEIIWEDLSTDLVEFLKSATPTQMKELEKRIAEELSKELDYPIKNTGLTLKIS